LPDKNEGEPDGVVLNPQANNGELQLDFKQFVESFEGEDESFGQYSADDVKSFSFEEFPSVQGDWSFDLEQGALLQILRLSRSIIDKDHFSSDTIRIAVSGNTLTACCSAVGIRGEVTVALFADRIGLDASQTVELVIGTKPFEQVCRAVSGVARFTVRSKDQLLIVTSVRFERPLLLLPKHKFMDLHAAHLAALQPEAAMTLPADTMSRAFAHLKIAIDPEVASGDMSVAEMRNGRLSAGTPSAIATFAHKTFTLTLRMRTRLALKLATILEAVSGMMQVECREKYNIFTAAPFQIAVESTSTTFADIEPLLNLAAAPDQFIAPKDPFLAALPKLLAALHKDNPVVRFRMKETGHDARCSIETRSPDGKRVKVSIKSPTRNSC
jgi:hypothetical protein